MSFENDNHNRNRERESEKGEVGNYRAGNSCLTKTNASQEEDDVDKRGRGVRVRIVANCDYL
jgi:hypothetical protein